MVYVAEMFEEDKKARKTYDKISSPDKPVKQDIPPGYYKFWCERTKNEKIIEGERRRVEVTTDKTIDLTIPSEDSKFE